MVGTLVGLRLRLLLRGARSGGLRAILGLVVSLTMAGLLGAGGLIAVAAARTLDHADALLIVGAVHAALFVGWSFGPVTSITSDGTIDPLKLAPYPLGGRDLIPGLLLGRALGPGGLFTALVLIGGVVAVGRNSGEAVVAAVASVLVFVLCLGSAGAVAAVLSAVAQKRRWRDLALFIGPAFAVVFNVASRALDGRVEADDFGGLRVAGRMVSAFPPAWPVRMLEGGEVAAGAALGSVALIALVGWAWARALARTMTNVAEEGVKAGPRRRILLPGLDRWPDRRQAAVFSKDLRLMWREPRQRAALLGLSAPLALAVFRSIAEASSGESRAPIAFLAVMVLGPYVVNVFGYDGPAYWLHSAAGSDLRADLAAKTAARLVLAGMVALALAAVGSIGALDWSRLASVLAITLAGSGVVAGVGAVFSVRSPIPQVDRTDPWSSGNSGRSSGGLVVIVATAGLALAAIAPFALALKLVDDVAWARAIVLLLAMAAGWVAWRIGVAKGSRADDGRDPDLLARLTVSAAD